MADESGRDYCSCMRIIPFACSAKMLSFFILCNYIASSFCLEEPVGYMRREYSLTKPYDVGGSLQHWDILGSAVATNSFIRLTPDHQSKQGALWNLMACYSRNWEVHINFKVHGQGTRLFGDGWAFWYTRDRSHLGTVFGSKDLFSGLGIFFDTYSNHNGEHAHEHPYISAQINNGSVAYDHDRDGTHSEVAGCTSYFRGVDTETSVAIRYLGSKKRLTVQQNVEGDGTWKECLDVEGIELPTGYYFGMSAATGDLADNHDIISMKFYELEEDDSESDMDFTNIVPRAASAAPVRDHVDDPKGSFSPRMKKFVNVMLALAIIGCVICGVGFVIYQKRQKDSLKRFY